jgi:hypothetical protein
MSEIVLFHVSTEQAVESIQNIGIAGPSYWTDLPELAAYYVQVNREEEKAVAIFSTTLTVLERSVITPDYPSLAEPITMVLNRTDKQIKKLWQGEEENDWQASLRIVRGVCVERIVAPENIQQLGNDHEIFQIADRNAKREALALLQLQDRLAGKYRPWLYE